MPQISTYPIISIPALDDLLIGTDIGNFEETKNFKVGDIASLVGGSFVPYTGATGNVNLGSFGITANSFVKLGGTSLQFLKADGSVDSTLYTPQSRTITINGVTYDLSGNRSWEIGAVESLSTAGTEGASTLNEGVLNIPQYQPSGNYITQLSGEATGAGSGSAAVVLSNSAVISKLLTGFNTVSGPISASDSILQAFGKAQSQINALTSGVSFRGVWNASTNTPTLTSGSGTGGHYYVVSVSGTTNLNGNASWSIGDWVIFNGTSSVWQRVPSGQLVSSVNGYTGAVSLTSADTGSATATRTLTINGTAFNLTADRAWTVGNIRSDSTYGNPSWITSLDWSKITGRPSTLAGYGITDGLYSTTTITINGVGYDLSANRTWSVGTVKSVAVSGPLTGGTITNTGIIGITQASSTTDGYLSAADWNMFDNKLASITATAPLSFAAGVISMSQAGASASGFLSQADWNTFNSKQDLIANPITGSGTSGKLPIFTGSGILSDSIVSYSANSLLFSYNSTSGNSFVLENTGIGSYSYAIVMDNYGLQRSTTHQYGPGNIVEVIGVNQVRRVFENGNTVLGVQTVDNGNKLSIYGTLFVNNVNNSTVNTNKFLVHDSGVVKFRTAAEVFSEIGSTRQITINGVAQDLSVDRSWSVGTVTSVSLSAPVGFAVSGSPVTGAGSLSLAFASGYSLPTVSSQASWDSAFNNTIVSAAVSGTTTKTLTLTQQDGGTVTASWTESGGGGGTITLTGNVTGSGTTSISTTIANNVVTNAMLAQIATASFLGRVTAATGNVETLTGTQATALLDTFTSSAKGLVPASGGGTTNFLRADGLWVLPPLITVNALTFNNSGDGMSSGSTWNGAAASVVSYNTIGAQPLATNLTSLSGLSFVSNSFVKMTAAGTFSLDTPTQATALLDTFTSTLKGLVPSPGSAGSTKFLREDGTWVVPSGGGGTTTNAVTFNNSGSGAASGTTFDGSVARTISYNTIGANKVITSGTSTPTGGVDGDIYLQYDVSLLTGSGTAGQVSFFTGASAISGDNGLFWDNTNKRLGINTVTPGVRLDIHSTNVIAQFNGTGTNNSYLDFQNAGSTQWRIGNQYAAAANRFSIFNAAGTSEVFTIIQGGNVGINRTSPNYSLDVNGTGFFTSLITSGASSPPIKLISSVNGTYGGANFAQYYRADGTTARAYIGYGQGNDQNFQMATQESGGILQFKSGAEILALTLGSDQSAQFAGNVGIGYTAPAAKLAVSGTALINTNTDNGVDKLQVSGSIISSSTVKCGANGVNGLIVNSGGATGAILNNTATSGGAGFDQIRLTFQHLGADRAYWYYSNSGNALVTSTARTADDITFAPGNSNALYMKGSTGNVIISSSGTDNGVDKLQVSGSAISTQYKLSALNTAPATASSSGTLGEIRIDATAIYICTATNTWKRALITTF